MKPERHFHWGIERVFEHFQFRHMEEVKLPFERRVVLLCMDAERIAEERLQRFATKLIEMGAVYFCCFGPGGKKMHDAADRARSEESMKLFDADISLRPPLIVTTWHEGDPLLDTVEFWCRYGYPRSDWGVVRTWTSIVIGHPEWHDEIEMHVATRELSDLEKGILPGRDTEENAEH